MDLIKFVGEKASKNSTLVKIHNNADPNSVWVYLGDEFMSRILYLPILQSEYSKLYFAQLESEIVGFLLLDSRKSHVELRNKRNLFVCFQATIRLLFSPRKLLRFLFVATFEVSGKIFGSELNIEIVSMMVKNEFQNQGIGSNLVEFAIDDIRKSSNTQKWITVTTFGDRSNKFYRKCNFVNFRYWKLFGISLSSLKLDLLS